MSLYGSLSETGIASIGRPWKFQNLPLKQSGKTYRCFVLLLLSNFFCAALKLGNWLWLMKWGCEELSVVWLKWYMVSKFADRLYCWSKSKSWHWTFHCSKKFALVTTWAKSCDGKPNSTSVPVWSEWKVTKGRKERDKGELYNRRYQKPGIVRGRCFL